MATHSKRGDPSDDDLQAELDARDQSRWEKLVPLREVTISTEFQFNRTITGPNGLEVIEQVLKVQKAELKESAAVPTAQNPSPTPTVSNPPSTPPVQHPPPTPLHSSPGDFFFHLKEQFTKASTIFLSLFLTLSSMLTVAHQLVLDKIPGLEGYPWTTGSVLGGTLTALSWFLWKRR
jgi:hypothetical protein